MLHDRRAVRSRTLCPKESDSGSVVRISKTVLDRRSRSAGRGRTLQERIEVWPGRAVIHRSDE